MNSDIYLCVPVNHFLKKDDWLPWVCKKQSVGHLINSSIISESPKSQIWILSLQVTSHKEWARSFGHLISVFLIGKVGNTCLVIFLGCFGMLMIQGKINHCGIKTIFWTCFLHFFLLLLFILLSYNASRLQLPLLLLFPVTLTSPVPQIQSLTLSSPPHKRASFPGTSIEYGTTGQDNTYFDTFCDIWVLT